MKSRITRSPVAAAILLLAACSTDRMEPTTTDVSSSLSTLGSSVGRIAPPQSRPHGKSYSEWAAEWWQWALGIP